MPSTSRRRPAPRRPAEPGRRPAAPARRVRPAPRPLARRTWAIPLTIVMALVLLTALALVGFRAARPGALPGTTVAGIAVGGLDADGIAQAVAPVRSQRQQRQLDARRASTTVTSTAGEIGYVLDEAATTDAVLRRGRQANPLAALADQVRATLGGIAVAPVESFDEGAFDDWTESLGDELGLPPIQAALRITGGDVEVVVPEAGETIDVTALRRAVLATLSDPEIRTIEVPTVSAAPTPSREEIASLEAQARTAISAPVSLSRDEVQLAFSGEQVGRMLTVRAQPVSGAGEAGDAQLVLAVDADALAASISAAQFQALARGPRDASFTVSGSSIQLIPARDGFGLDVDVAANQLLEVATTEGTRTAELAGETTPPAFTTEEAQALGITEQVATFTTDHPCCQGRVTNIQRMADLVRGTIVMPDEVFSLNGLVGPRTTANGFVHGGALESGEIVEQTGGGVSQFTTTLFNAVFFGGYEILEFRPHSIYITRYPLGREATLNFDPPIDLRFRNDSPDAIYLHTSYTDTSITVALFSTTWAEVTTTTSDRYGLRPPAERWEETDELPAGEEQVEQEGRDGFSVDFTRELRYVDGRREVERYTTNYQPEPRIILVGTGAEPSEEPTPTPSPTQEPTEEAAPPPPPEPEPEPTADPSPAPT